MKKVITFFCTFLILAVILPVQANADVIYQPYDDFYFAHMNECEYVCRNYTANGPNGTVTLYTDPVTNMKEAECPNGMTLYVSYTYETDDGTLWGCCDDREAAVTGWAPMEYLELIYDGISFAEEYSDQFVETEIIPDANLIVENTIWFWPYPGCSDPFSMPVSEDNLPACYRTYTDEKGDIWGQCGYHYGIKNHWINLSNPSADYETLFPNPPEETVPAETIAAERVPEIKPAGGNLILIVSVAVAVVVIATGLMLIALKKRKV